MGACWAQAGAARAAEVLAVESKAVAGPAMETTVAALRVVGSMAVEWQVVEEKVVEVLAAAGWAVRGRSKRSKRPPRHHDMGSARGQPSHDQKRDPCS